MAESSKRRLLRSADAIHPLPRWGGSRSCPYEHSIANMCGLVEYEKRWAIEVLFKELRGSLGLGDYQVLPERGIRNHLHLCGLAHLLLTHHSLSAVGAQAKKEPKEVPLPPLSQRREALRDAVRREQIER